MALSSVIEGMKEHASEAIPYIKDDIIKAVDNAAHGAVSCVADEEEICVAKSEWQGLDRTGRKG